MRSNGSDACQFIEEFTAMKTLLLASVLALTASVGAAFASVTVYTDGSTYNSATGVTTVPLKTYAMAGAHTATDAPVWRTANGPKVVRWGPPDAKSSVGG
jgi:hypothetical protein